MTIAAVVGASTVWLVRRDATAHSKSLGLDRGILKSMWSFVRRSYPNHVLGIVASTADRVLIEKAVGAAPLAGYAVASRIPEVISSLLQPIQETMQPLLSRAHVLGEREFAAQVARATRMALAVGCGFIFVPCGFAEPLLKLWLRDQYVPDLAPIVAGIALYRAFEFYNLSVLLSFIAAGEPGRATPTSIWNAVTTAALSFPVALHFGLPGIVVMNVIIQVQFVPLTWVLFRKVIPDGPLRSQLVAAAGILAISGASAAGAWALAGVEVIARWPWLALVAAPVWSAATVLVFARLGLTPLPSSLARWAGKLGAASENRREAGDGC
jgi:O-antigen/teichoic acid export membrane protein